MMQLKAYEIYSMFPCKETTVRISIQNGPSSIICKRSSQRKCLGEFVQDEDTRVCSAMYKQETDRDRAMSRRSKIEDYCKKTYWPDDQVAQLLSPEWKEISQKSQRENGRRKPTVFKTRLLQFSSRKWSWTTSTIVFSCSKGADTDWRMKALESQGRMSFSKERSGSLQKLPQRHFYESVM